MRPRPGVDYPETDRLKAARVALIVADDPDVVAVALVERRAAYAEALDLGPVLVGDHG